MITGATAFNAGLLNIRIGEEIEMQKITVKSIKVDRGETNGREWTKTTITGEDGSQFQSFDTKLSSLVEGSIINAEIEVKGKYVNIKKWEMVDGLVSNPLPLPKQDNKNKSMALSYAKDLACAGKIELDQIKAYATKFEEYLNG